MPEARDPRGGDVGASRGSTWGPTTCSPRSSCAFIGLPGALREIFLEAHRDLFDADFWNRMQALRRAGEIVDIFPYQDERRLRGR